MSEKDIAGEKMSEEEEMETIPQQTILQEGGELRQEKSGIIPQQTAQQEKGDLRKDSVGTTPQQEMRELKQKNVETTPEQTIPEQEKGEQEKRDLIKEQTIPEQEKGEQEKRDLTKGQTIPEQEKGEQEKLDLTKEQTIPEQEKGEQEKRDLTKEQTIPEQEKGEQEKRDLKKEQTIPEQEKGEQTKEQTMPEQEKGGEKGEQEKLDLKKEQTIPEQETGEQEKLDLTKEQTITEQEKGEQEKGDQTKEQIMPEQEKGDQTKEQTMPEQEKLDLTNEQTMPKRDSTLIDIPPPLKAVWKHLSVSKKIDANKEILETYHESILFGKVPNHVKARSTLQNRCLLLVWNLVEFLFALLSGVLYVYSLYNPGLSSMWIQYTQLGISFGFLFDYVMRILRGPEIINFLLSLWGFINFISFVPAILILRKHISMEVTNVLHLLEFLRFVRIFPASDKWVQELCESSLLQQIMMLSLGILASIFLSAGIFQWAEDHTILASRRASCSSKGCTKFWESFYFIIVTVTTVGYGDITPKTKIGQSVIIIIIVAFVVILPLQIGRIQALAYCRPYGRSFICSKKRIESRFFILSGSFTFNGVQSFLAEFYNTAHAEDPKTQIIVLAPFSPWSEFKQIILLYNGLVSFCEGSPLCQDDLKYLNAHKASAIFLFADKTAKDRQIEDATQVIRALAVHHFCIDTMEVQRTPRIILEVLESETQKNAVWDQANRACIEVLCPTVIHYKMIARSCIVHGLYTLITNLFSAHLQIEINSNNFTQHFTTELCESYENKIYPVLLPTEFGGMSFEKVAEIVFKEFQSLFIAVDTQIKSTESNKTHRKVLLYPKNYKIRVSDVGIIITRSFQTCYAISKYHLKEIVHVDEQTEKSTDPEPIVKTTLSKDKGSSSGQVVNTSWPPLSLVNKPEPSLIDLNLSTISSSLQRKTLTRVELNDKHILVCCQTEWPSNIFYFLVEIRKPGFPKSPVVILCPKNITPQQWGSVEFFEDVYLLKGSPTSEWDLLRGGVLDAEKVIILSSEGVAMDFNGGNGNGREYIKRIPPAYTSDMENVIIVATVEKLCQHNPQHNVIVEMRNAQAICNLKPQCHISQKHFSKKSLKRNKDGLVYFEPSYMEGKALSPTMLGFLMKSSFYNKNTVSIIEQLTYGGFSTIESTGQEPGTRRVMLHLLPIPEKHKNKPTYMHLFLQLFQEEHQLVIGLYRVKGTIDAPGSYVFTNPKPDCIVDPDDLIYVLAQDKT